MVRVSQATHCPGLRRLHVGGTLITYYTVAALTSLEDLQDVSETTLSSSAILFIAIVIKLIIIIIIGNSLFT